MAEQAKPKAKNPTAHKKFEIKGDTVTRKNSSCPKCGQGYSLANHKNRKSCGKCGYTEFSNKE